MVAHAYTISIQGRDRRIAASSGTALRYTASSRLAGEKESQTLSQKKYICVCMWVWVCTHTYII